jgi:CRISPR/Cas system-associated protein Csx1
MPDIYLNTDHMFKQEQYKDLIRQADKYRLIKAEAEPEAEDVQKRVRNQRRGVAGMVRRLAGLVPLSPALI